jgi:hypothetical protein
MIEVIGIETTKIYVGEFTEYDKDDFLCLMGTTPSLWCDGYLIGFNPINDKEFDKRMEKGERWYRRVDYCKVPNYKNQLQSEHCIVSQVIDYSKSKLAQAMVKKIKEFG